MNGIFGKAKDYVWGLMNAPDTEPMDEVSDEWYEGDGHERPERGYRDMFEPEQPQPRYEEEPRRERRNVSTRQAQNNKVLEMYNRGTGGSEVVIRHPMDVSEAAKVCDFIREDKVCVVDLTGMDRGMAQRIADFLGGACYAINGCIQRISKDIFIIAPEGVRISGDVKDELEKDGYVIPKASGRR